MSALRELQTAFSTAMAHQGDDAITALMPTDDAIPPSVRLDIYRNNITSALVRSLEGLYPALKALTGEEFFQALMRDFITHNPPGDGHIMGYGLDLAAFLEGHPACENHPFLVDIAQLESAWYQAYSADEAPPMEADQLATIPADAVADTRLVMHPSCRWLQSSYPASRIWQTAVSPTEDADLPNLDDGPEWLLVIRPEHEVEVRTLNAAEFIFLKQLEQNSIGDAYSATIEQYADFDLAMTLANHLNAGTFVGIADI